MPLKVASQLVGWLTMPKESLGTLSRKVPFTGKVLLVPAQVGISLQQVWHCCPPPASPVVTFTPSSSSSYRSYQHCYRALSLARSRTKGSFGDVIRCRRRYSENVAQHHHPHASINSGIAIVAKDGPLQFLLCPLILHPHTHSIYKLWSFKISPCLAQY